MAVNIEYDQLLARYTKWQEQWMSYLQQQRQRYYQRREESEKALASRRVTSASRENVLLDMDRQFHSAFQKLQNTFTEQNEAELKVLKNWESASLQPRALQSPSGATLEYSSSELERVASQRSLQVSERRLHDTYVPKAPGRGVERRPLPIHLSPVEQRPLQQTVPVLQPHQMGPVVSLSQQSAQHAERRPLHPRTVHHLASRSPITNPKVLTQKMAPVVSLSQQLAQRAQRRPLHPRTVHHLASRSPIPNPKVLTRPKCQTRRVPLIPSHAMMRSVGGTNESRASISSVCSLIEAPDTQTLDDRPGSQWARLLCHSC